MSALTPRVAHSFARGAGSYHDAAVAQREIAARLFAALRAAAGPKRFARVLEAGCGTGHLSRHLSTLAPERLWLNDLSATPPALPRAVALPGDIAQIDLPGRFDLVASSSMIQWLEDPGAVVARLAGAVAPGGFLALSGFGPDHFPELRALGSCAGAPSCRNGAGLAALLPAGWQVAGAGDWPITLKFDSALAVLQHLRATGVNARAGQIRSRGALLRFLHAYEDRFATTEGVPLTYAASWLVARRASQLIRDR